MGIQFRQVEGPVGSYFCLMGRETKGENLEENAMKEATEQAEVQSARTFVLVGLLFYILGSVVWGILFVRTLLFGTLVSFGFGTVSLGVEPVLVDLGAFGFLVPGIFLGAAVGLTVWTWGTLQ